MIADHHNLPRGVVRLHNGDALFPEELRSIPSPPEELFLRGRIPPAPRVAVVGSRQADAYGLQIARELGLNLARAGACIVSGGAGGVDTAALEGCLEGGGRPVAVLGTGVDVPYPVGNRELFERLAAVGAVISEYPPGAQGNPGRFVRRNRLVSGLSCGVVVVQAALKSGSLITAREAAAQGKQVLAVPGLAGHPLSAGVHALLRRGAKLVESAADVLEALALGHSLQSELPMAAPVPPLLPEEEKLWQALTGDCPIDVLTGRTGLASGQVSALLLQMELKGLVVQKPGMVYRRSEGIRAPAAEEG